MKSCGVIKFSAVHELVSSLYSRTDASFRATYSPPESSALGVYDLHFQKQWQKRWHYLRVDQQLSIQDIGRHAAVLQTDLDTLAARWAVLTSIGSSVASFRPVDHLTALATMGEEEEEEEGFYKFLPANTADRLCQSWQSCSNHHEI